MNRKVRQIIFKKLAEERGFGAEDIADRFGVTPQVMRQRLRLAAVSPKLMQVYRDGGLTIEQLMAFAITEDHARQEAVYERLSYNRDASAIRRGGWHNLARPLHRGSRRLFRGCGAA